MSSPINNLPDISFIDDAQIEDVRGDMISDFEDYMTKATGRAYSLERVSPHRASLYAASAQIYQAMQYVDRAGKQSLLKYSYGDFLNNLGALKRVTREPPQAAVTKLRFTLAAHRPVATGIPQGTRAVSAGTIYFRTREYAEIPPGSLFADVQAECTVTGIEGNALSIGEINKIVDPIPYVDSVTNLTETAGGTDVESDADFAERIYLAPSAYSTAGPENAYIYHTKNFNNAIGDVVARSDQAAGRVDIVFLMSDGSTPPEETITGIQDHLRDGEIRPMTDLVTVSAPAEVTYEITLTYYINRSESSQAVAIQSAVEAAVNDYISWQRNIGRDINPSKLLTMIINAGAKRVEIEAPVFTQIDGISVAAIDGDPVVSYGGLEDD